MAHERLLGYLTSGRSSEPKTLEEFFDAKGQEAWNRLCDAARAHPQLVDEELVTWLVARDAQAPGTLVATLINVAAREEPRREELVLLCRRILAKHPEHALAAAGYHLHEYHRLLDGEWLAAAQEHFDANPGGAWGIFESASMYEPKLIRPEHVEWFETKRAAKPRDYFVCLFSLASHWEDRRATLLSRVLANFTQHPAEAVDAAAFSAKDEKELLSPELFALVLAHFDRAPEKAWEFFDGACRRRPELFDAAMLDALTARTIGGPGTLLSILRRLMDGDPALMDRYTALVRKHPKEGINNVRYDYQNEDIKLVRRDLVQALCAGFEANAYPAFEFLRRLIFDRPELLGQAEVDAAVKNIPHATNYAFGFFRELLKQRPEFTRDCAHALFECLALEPVNRAHVRAEEMESLMAISEAAHVKTGLEKALAEPPTSGSRRARALMAVMFRQKQRARRHVLLEALRHAATTVLWRKQTETREADRYSPIWDFAMFIIDHADADAISTAAAETFLEGAFQLSYLCQTGAEHDAFLRNLDLADPPAIPFPAGAEFLDADRGLAELHHLVVALGQRFGLPVLIKPIDEFARRATAAGKELAAISKKEGTRVKKRADHVARWIELWKDPAYARAFTDAEAEKALPDDAKALLKREKKDLAKQVRDALKAEAIRIAVAAVERSRRDLYRNRLRDILGRDVEIDRIEPKLLPSFLWFQAIRGMKKNSKWLKRLIEDRMEGRPHDWMRTEPESEKWAERVRKGSPGVRMENWRSPFHKEFVYRPGDALAEKKRRIKADLAQARTLLEKAGAEGIAETSYAALETALKILQSPPPEKETKTKRESTRRKKRKPVDPAVLEEISMNLERVRIAEQTPDSDFEGKVALSVETDPFEMLFMGEYGFASCLSLRGGNAWSAVSNAIDIDKAIVWAREPGGNVVGRRLLALTPSGVLTFRTYTNRHGLPLDRIFDEFIKTYAEHCGTKIAHGVKVGPLLSDQWYDDGSL